MPDYCIPCGGKISYDTRDQAASAARILVRRGKQQSRRGRLQPYKCPRGAVFHVGHWQR